MDMGLRHKNREYKWEGMGIIAWEYDEVEMSKPTADHLYNNCNNQTNAILITTKAIQRLSMARLRINTKLKSKGSTLELGNVQIKNTFE